MANLLGFRSMLADKAAADKGLPGVCLRCSTDLDIALARLINVDNRREDESDSQVTIRYVDENCDSISSPSFMSLNEELKRRLRVLQIRLMRSVHLPRHWLRPWRKPRPSISQKILMFLPISILLMCLWITPLGSGLVLSCSAVRHIFRSV